MGGQGERDEGEDERAGGRFGGGKRPPMMGVKRSAKKRPRSSTHRGPLLFVAFVFARRRLPLYPTERRKASAVPRPGAHMAEQPGTVAFTARNTQDARNYGLSIISYASRYLLNIGACLFLRRACVSRREKEREKRVSSVKDGEYFLFCESFDTWPNVGDRLLFDLTGSLRDSALRKSHRRPSCAPENSRGMPNKQVYY